MKSVRWNIVYPVGKNTGDRALAPQKAASTGGGRNCVRGCVTQETLSFWAWNGGSEVPVPHERIGYELEKRVVRSFGHVKTLQFFPPSTPFVVHGTEKGREVSVVFHFKSTDFLACLVLCAWIPLRNSSTNTWLIHIDYFANQGVSHLLHRLSHHTSLDQYTSFAKDPWGFDRPENRKEHSVLSRATFVEWPNTTSNFSLQRGVAPPGKLTAHHKSRFLGLRRGGSETVGMWYTRALFLCFS